MYKNIGIIWFANPFQSQISKFLYFEISLKCIKHVAVHLFIFRYADRVSVGDEILAQVNDEMVPTKVINVSNLILQGDCLFNSF